MKISEALMTGIAKADAEVLLAALLKKDRTWLIAHPDHEFLPEHERQWIEWSARRKEGEPVAYITGEQEFYGRNFLVNRSVLIPRPSTEGLVDLTMDFLNTGNEGVRDVDTGIVAIARVLQNPRDRNIPVPRVLVDIGTGSGCIAITLALERPDLRIIATDISENALRVARENAERHGVMGRIRFVHGNLLEPIHDLREPFVIVSNPPYIATHAELARDVRDFEPNEALFGGGDGADIVRNLLVEAQAHAFCRGMIIEILNSPIRQAQGLWQFSILNL